MDNSDPILKIIESCVLSPSATPASDICDKASDLLRRINDRVPARALGKARSCPHIVAIELAFRCLSVLFSKEKLFAQAGIPSKELTQASTNCKLALRLAFPRVSAIDILCVQFGASLRGAALGLLEDYQKLYVGRLDPVRQKLIDLETAEYQAAAYFLAAKQKKASVDKRKLLEVTEVSSPLFHKILSDLEKVCVRDGGVSNSNEIHKGMQRIQSKTSRNPSASARAQPGPTKVAAAARGRAHSDGPHLGKENVLKHAKQLHITTTASLSTSVSPTMGTSVVADRSAPDNTLQDELQLASMAAAQRSMAFNATKRRIIDASSNNSKASEASKQEEKHRKEEAERQAAAEKRKLEQRESYNLWKAETLKKRKLGGKGNH
jgi:hypothetical protein